METIQLQESQPCPAVELSEGSAQSGTSSHHRRGLQAGHFSQGEKGLLLTPLTPSEALPLRNRFSALQAEEELGKTSREATAPTEPVPSSNTWKKQQVIV